MKDSYDIITEGSLLVCPECGNYDADGYDVLDMMELPDDMDHPDVSQCSICGRYFR